MNFRTTLFLLVLLLIIGSVLLFTRNAGEKIQPSTASKVIDLSPVDVLKISITPDGEKTITIEKNGAHWKLTAPMNGPAEDENVTSLLDALTALDSRGHIDAGGENAQTTGLDQPKFKIDILAALGKTYQLDVGNRSGTGDNVYVKLGGKSQADIVPAALYDLLDKPLKSWRREKLLEVGGPQISQVKIATTQQTIDLQKQGENWIIAGPTTIPADTNEVSDLTLALANMKVADFVDDTDAKRFGLDHPAVRVSFATAPASTQPTTAPAFTELSFGRYDSVMKQNVYAAVSDQTGIVKIPATVLETFRKSQLDLRDRQLINLDPQSVKRISLTTEKAATTMPTTQPESETIVRLDRRPPTTMPATTQTTQPTSKPTSVWTIAGAVADDAKVNSLLSEFHPLRVSDYLAAAPTTQPTIIYELEFQTDAGTTKIALSDIGKTQPLVGSYNGMIFEVPRWINEKFQADFAHITPPAAPANEP